MRKNIFPTALTLFALILTSGLTARAQNPPIYSPVLFYYDGNNLPVPPTQAHLDGTGAQILSATPGDLSWNGIPGARSFIRAEIRAGVTDSNAPNDVVAYNESTSVRTVLTGTQDIHRSALIWSKDSQRIAYYGKRYDLVTGLLLESGLYVGDISYTGSTPSQVSNEHLVVPDSASTTDAQGNVTTFSFYLWDWMYQGGNSTRLAFTVLSVTRTSTGAFVSKSFEEFIADVGSFGTQVGVTPVPLKLDLPATSGDARFMALASPVDGRIAFGTYSTSTSRYDIYVASVPAVYTGGALSLTRLTNTGRNATSTTSIQHIGWSPDGSYLYWDGVPGNGQYIAILRIASNGSGSQITVIGKKGGYDTLGQIRP